MHNVGVVLSGEEIFCVGFLVENFLILVFSLPVSVVKRLSSCLPDTEDLESNTSLKLS